MASRATKSPVTTYVCPKGQIISKIEWSTLGKKYSNTEYYPASFGNGMGMWVEWKGAEVESDTRHRSNWRIWYVRVGVGSWDSDGKALTIPKASQILCQFFPDFDSAKEYALTIQRDHMGYRAYLVRNPDGSVGSVWAGPDALIENLLTQEEIDRLNGPQLHLYGYEAGSW